MGDETPQGRKRGCIAATLTVALFLAACDVPTEPARPKRAAPLIEAGHDSDTSAPPGKKPELKESVSEPNIKGIAATITRVVDGDTVHVSLKGEDVSVRLIGIDTPETVHPSEPVQCFGREASDFTHRELDGREVLLEFDVERIDRYGRTLAYVWLDGNLFNRAIVARGYGQVSTYPPNVKYVDRFLAAQRSAGNKNKGLWSGCPVEGDRSTDSGHSGSKKCDPNYSGACVPPYPPDLACSDIPQKNFRSTGSDPHAFDGDGDGRACES